MSVHVRLLHTETYDDAHDEQPKRSSYCHADDSESNGEPDFRSAYGEPDAGS